jgi:FKBP-type peptidyl-prolyl cis-trans isomerase
VITLFALLASCARSSPPIMIPTGEQPFFYGPPAEAARTESGISWTVLTPGTGTTHPTAQDTVTVHYSGWTGDGAMFDSSHSRGKPMTFGLNQVIPGWTEGVQLMVEGETTRFWIPADQAYGYSGSGPIGQLVFDIELIEIK